MDHMTQVLLLTIILDDKDLADVSSVLFQLGLGFGVTGSRDVEASGKKG